MSNKILVIGSTNVDFLIKSDRLPAFGETVTGGIFMQNFGGKGANQAVGAARAGGDVTFVTCLGEDLYAEELLRSFRKDKIDTRFVFKEASSVTGSALIMLDKNGNNYLSVAPGANFRLTPAHIDKTIDIFQQAEIIVLQMEIPFETTAHVFELAKKYHKKVLFNLAPARPFDLSVLKQVYAFVVNEVEASMVTGLKVETDDEIQAAASAILNLGCEIAVITLGARGSFIASADNRQFVPAFSVKAVDTTAAGDVYCGSLSVALVEGKPLFDAVRFAGAASAISVTRLGAQPSAPSRKEIDDLVSGKNSARLKRFFLLLMILLMPFVASAQKSGIIHVLKRAAYVQPLDQVEVTCNSPGILVLKDSKNREYVRTTAAGQQTVQVAGSAGIHTAVLLDKKGQALDSTKFRVAAETNLEDGGKTGEMFRLFHSGMLVYDPDGVEEVTWNGKTYRYFVNWVLDNANTAKGMQYFSPYSRDLVDLLRENQQDDGMIWSFVQPDQDDYHYYETAYTYLGYFDRNKGMWFVRQPAENHVEYNYVNMMYYHWKASGDNAWMKANLDCAMRALDYCVTDTLKWSKRFQLLKRPYCIDSWDFQVDDEYTPHAPLSPTMVVVPGKTKFGIFFGDNTGYYEACNQLAEMLESEGQKNKALLYRQRARDILARLDALSWNGEYYTHFIDEDPSVKRNLGVDEKSQIAQGNMYSVNRGLPHDMNVAIINTYLDLKKRLPPGSPGEWYAIYPPFEKGFGPHNEKWQYMNGGVAGHAAGELARGAFENGYEKYGSEILEKLLTLGKENGNRIWFAYTGSIPPPPPPPRFITVNIAEQANMDLWDKGGNGVAPWMNTTRPGNDMRGIPTGDQVFQNIPFKVIDPAGNQRRSVISVSTSPGSTRTAEVPVMDTAACIYLLHSSSDNIPSNVAGAITFRYTDGTEASQYIMKGKEVTNWWFSSLQNEHAGVAWWGPNLCSTKVGVCWAAIHNPWPTKEIASLLFHAPLEGGIYAILGITLSDTDHYVKPKVESFGGPDNWAAANAMAALVEGLAGVKNDGLAFDKVILSPRWPSAGVDSVSVTIRLAASEGYVAYQYAHNKTSQIIEMVLTGSGTEVRNHILLPESNQSVNSVRANGQPIEYSISKTENSSYVDFNLELPAVHHITIDYSK